MMYWSFGVMSIPMISVDIRPLVKAGVRDTRLPFILMKFSISSGWRTLTIVVAQARPAVMLSKASSYGASRSIASHGEQARHKKQRQEVE